MDLNHLGGIRLCIKLNLAKFVVNLLNCMIVKNVMVFVARNQKKIKRKKNQNQLKKKSVLVNNY